MRLLNKLQSIVGITIIATSLVLALLVISSNVYAASTQEELLAQCQGKTSAFCDGLRRQTNPGGSQKGSLINNVINILASVAGVIAVLFVIFGGFKYITSSGEPNKAAEGRQTIIYALVGIVVVLLSRQILLYGVGLLTK